MKKSLLLVILLASFCNVANAEESACEVTERYKYGKEFNDEDRGPIAFDTETTVLPICADFPWNFIVYPDPQEPGKCAPWVFPPRTDENAAWWAAFERMLATRSGILTESADKLEIVLPGSPDLLKIILELDASHRVTSLDVANEEYRCEYRYNDAQPLVTVHCEPTVLAAGMDSTFWDFDYNGTCEVSLLR